MCGGGSGASEAIAKQAQKDADDRQARINLGMAQLDKLFGGETTKGVNALGPDVAYDPSKTYYDPQGNPITWTTPDPAQGTPGKGMAPPVTDPNYYGGVGSLHGMAPIGGTPTAASGSEWLAKLMSGDGVYGGKETTGFGPTLYNKAYQAQKDFALPQVETQFQEAQRQLAYGLARQGIQQSSTAGQLNANLGAQHALALNDVEEKANAARTNLQQSVSDEKNDLVRLLQSTGDNTSMLNSAQSQSALLQQKQPLQEVGPLFQNATGSLADMIVSPALRQQPPGGGAGGYGSGGSRGSGKVIPGS